MSEKVCVRQCACLNRPFDELIAAYGDLESAQRATGAGRECGGCLPYLKLAMATGEHAVDVDDVRLAERVAA